MNRRAKTSAGHKAARSRRFHETCFACAPKHEKGLHLRYESSGIQTTCRAEIAGAYQSYDGIVHGGILATVLDATMIQCVHNMFRADPLTSRLDIRWRHEVSTESPIIVSACATSRRGDYVWAHATALQDDRICVTAHGVFKLVPSSQDETLHKQRTLTARTTQQHLGRLAHLRQDEDGKE